MSAEVRHHDGGYRYIEGGSWSSLGVVAAPGTSLTRSEFLHPIPLPAALDVVAAQLDMAGRPLEALCGLELRQPALLSVDSFDEQNAHYLVELGRNGLLTEGRSTIARTNVVPVDGPPTELSIIAYTWTTPEPPASQPHYVITGIADVSGPKLPDDIVSRGRRDESALAAKSETIVAELVSRLKALAVTWQPTDDTVIYADRSDVPPHGIAAMDQHWDGADQSLRWVPSHPPVDELELEIDARRCVGHTTDGVDL